MLTCGTSVGWYSALFTAVKYSNTILAIIAMYFAAIIAVHYISISFDSNIDYHLVLLLI